MYRADLASLAHNTTRIARALDTSLTDQSDRRFGMATMRSLTRRSFMGAAMHVGHDMHADWLSGYIGF